MVTIFTKSLNHLQMNSFTPQSKKDLYQHSKKNLQASQRTERIVEVDFEPNQRIVIGKDVYNITIAAFLTNDVNQTNLTCCVR